MTQHFDISDVRAQFAYRVALQNKQAAMSMLPEETPDYAGALALDAAFDGAVYRTLCRKDTPTPQEIAYMREYEHYHVTGDMVIFSEDL